MQRRQPLSFGMERFSGLYLWGIFIITFGIWVPHLFLTAATLHSVASDQAVAAILAIGVLVPLAAGQFDLSIGAMVNLSAILVTSLQSTHKWGMWPAIAVAIGTTFLLGVFNGMLVVKFRISSFIATLGMATVVAAVQVIISGESQPLPPSSSAWANLTQVKIGGFQVIVVYVIVVALFFWWVLDHTPVGRYVYATGGNLEAAKLSGVQTDRWIWLSLITSSTMAGLAGVLYGSLSGPSLTFGAGLLLPAFAAVFLGSTQVKPGRFNVWGTLLAVYVLATGVQGLQFVTGVQWLSDMFDGVALLAAVGFAGWRQRRASIKRSVSRPPTKSSPEPSSPDGPGSEELKRIPMAR